MSVSATVAALLRRCRVLLLLPALWAVSAPAAPPPLSSDFDASFDLEDEPLVSFLQRLFTDQGLQVVMSPRLKETGRTLNGLLEGTPSAIYRQVMASNQLVDYYDGQSVYVHLPGEVATRFFVVPTAQLSTFRSTARSTIASDRDNYFRLTQEGLIAATGVPSYLARMEDLARAVGAVRRTVEERETVFKYFPLEYAFAADRSFRSGNRQVTVPGVATILRDLINGSGRIDGAAFRTPRDSELPASRPSLRGSGLAAIGSELRSDDGPRVVIPGDNSARYQPARPRPASAPIIAAGGSGPARIVADPHRNAVIIRDVPERISAYRDLIDALDKPIEIVEIAATIIDVNVNRLRDLGVEYRYGEDDFEAGFAESGSKSDFLGALGASDVALLDQVPGFQIGAIIGDENQFITRINALEEEGAVSIISRPQVLTLNNTEAVLESAREVYVPVEGAFEVDLFNVFAGTVLRVTPHIIDADARRRIRLFIGVEDGDVLLDSAALESDSGRVIPSVTRTSVNTQALINAGQSLLLGGLVRDRASTQVRKVPFLGDIPVVGRLFRSDNESRDRIERLFLIAPRMVDLDGRYTADNAPGTGGATRSPAAQARAIERYYDGIARIEAEYAEPPDDGPGTAHDRRLRLPVLE